MKTSTIPIQTELVLIGGGHANIQVLKSFAMSPIDGLRVSLISDVLNAPYSGMLPGFISGEYSHEDMHINLLNLSNSANARFIHAKITSINTEHRIIHCEERPHINYDLISINTGIAPDLEQIEGAKEYAVAVKPISHFLNNLPKIDMKIKSPQHSLIIVGSGAAAIELAFAFRTRFNKKKISPRIIIVGGAERFFPELSLKCHLSILNKCKRACIEVKFGQPATKVSSKSVTLASGIKIASDFTLLVTGGIPQNWLRNTSLGLTDDYYIEVNKAYQSISDERVFAAGDVAKVRLQPRPRSGVFAVRAGPVLSKNLRLKLNNSPLQNISQQSRHLSLIMTGNETVMAIWGKLFMSSKWLWLVKKWIDKRFISNFTNLPKMAENHHRSILLSKNELIRENDPLLEKMFCSGCGSKAAANILDTVLPKAINIASKLGGDKRYLSMLNTYSDAGEFPLELNLDGKQTIVQTVDSISQMISDPFIFGRISALHALSDLAVSNAIPLTALSMINIHRAKRNLQESDLTNMLSGALLEFSKAKTKLIGGHTSQSFENSLGFALTGIKKNISHLESSKLLEKERHKTFSIILTKPLGIGIILAAAMRNLVSEQNYQECINCMLQSNLEPAQFLWKNGAVAMTDVTGFGLARHLENITMNLQNHFGVDIGAQLILNKIPIIDGVHQILEKTSIRATLNESNKKAIRHLDKTKCKNLPLSDILFDPQTSGGILAIVPKTKATKLCKVLKNGIAPFSKQIGTVKFNKSGIFIS